jgi:hypothetical protein
MNRLQNQRDPNGTKVTYFSLTAETVLIPNSLQPKTGEAGAKCVEFCAQLAPKVQQRGVRRITTVEQCDRNQTAN